MAFHNAPLLAMPPLTSPNNNVHRHREAGEAGEMGAETNATPSLYQIPFQATPVQHAPTPLTFGFGFGAGPSTPSSGAPASTMGLQWGQTPYMPSPSMSPSALRHSPSSRGLAAVSGKRSDAKRRRDSEEEDSDDDMEGAREERASPMSYNRKQQALPKRMRAGIGAVGMINLKESRMPSSVRSSAPPAESSSSATVDKMDLGKVLCE